jgi:hypothetical protein
MSDLGYGVVFVFKVIAQPGVNQEEAAPPVFNCVSHFFCPKPEAAGNSRQAHGHDPQVAKVVRRGGKNDLRVAKPP